jgi:tRNA-specific 2-thiouridylase
MAKNEVYVTRQLDDERLWADTLTLTDMHWIAKPLTSGSPVKIRTRHRAPLVKGQLQVSGAEVIIKLDDEIRAATPGQSAVLYVGQEVAGGGIIC